jgi:hypothetical protein
MLRMRRDYPRLTFRGPWSGGLASMHSAPLSSGNDGVLARRAFAGFCAAPLARPCGPEPCGTSCIDELIVVN